MILTAFHTQKNDILKGNNRGKKIAEKSWKSWTKLKIKVVKSERKGNNCWLFSWAFVRVTNSFLSAKSARTKLEFGSNIIQMRTGQQEGEWGMGKGEKRMNEQWEWDNSSSNSNEDADADEDSLADQAKQPTSWPVEHLALQLCCCCCCCRWCPALKMHKNAHAGS